MKKIFLFITLFILMNPLFAAEVKETWQLTTAKLSLIKDDAKKLKPEGTAIGQLLELNKRSLWSMMEVNGTVLSVVISYTPVGQDKPIKQMGFFRTFSLPIQYQLEAKGIMYKLIEAKIAYLTTNPLTIRFLIKESLEDTTPVLVKID